jgi:hypothetical protein
MTDITLGPTTEPAKTLIKLPKLLQLGFAKAFDGFLKCYGDALTMAYVEPFFISARRQRPVPDADLEGRDPNW